MDHTITCISNNSILFRPWCHMSSLWLFNTSCKYLLQYLLHHWATYLHNSNLLAWRAFNITLGYKTNCFVIFYYLVFITNYFDLQYLINSLEKSGVHWKNTVKFKRFIIIHNLLTLSQLCTLVLNFPYCYYALNCTQAKKSKISKFSFLVIHLSLFILFFN